MRQSPTIQHKSVGSTYYETLGVEPKATAAEIRSAYRRLALLHHPDQSKARDAAVRFGRISEAYQVLSDPEKRREYDKELVLLREGGVRAAQRAQVASETAPPPASRPPRSHGDLPRLAVLFSRGRFEEAERLAYSILDSHPREAMAYAILGDIARTRGEINHAANMYAHAAQMDPRNPLYHQRYEELLHRAAPGISAVEGSEGQTRAILVSTALCVVTCCYMALATEKAIAPLGLTLGSLVMLFLSGVVVGTAYSLGGILDRFQGFTLMASGRVSPLLGLSLIALVSFWAAAALYGLIALTQRSFSPSVNRLIGATVVVVAMAFLAAQVSPSLNPGSVLLWGGNLVYLGSIAGWATADALRSSS